MMGRWKKDGNNSSTKNKLVQDSDRNEQNWYPDPDSNKTKISYTNELNEAHKTPWKKKFFFIEMLLDMANQNI
jgi:hypothetical protein